MDNVQALAARLDRARWIKHQSGHRASGAAMSVQAACWMGLFMALATAGGAHAHDPILDIHLHVRHAD